MRFGIFLLFLIINIHKVASQKGSEQFAGNLIYLEAGGVGGYGSVNYERIIHNKEKLMFALRLGLSSYHILDFTSKLNPDILIPLFISGYFGGNHKIEMGFGQTISNIVHADLTNFQPKRITNFSTGFSIGYRYQKNTGGIILRFAYTPIIEINRNFRHWAGISTGYSF